MFTSQLDTHLSQFATQNKDLYLGVTSKNLKCYEALKCFWRDYMVEECGEELEVDELYSIFIKETYKDGANVISVGTFISILEHYYDITLVDYKYIINYKCALWDKMEETRTIMDDLKITYKFSPDCFEKSIDGIYNDYCIRCETKFNYRVSNKRDFEKYINQIIPDKYIIRKRILNDYWNS